MKAISAYRSEDGTLHETREGAACADLVSMGFDLNTARQIIDQRTEIDAVFRQASGLGHIPVYYPSLEPPEAA